MSNNIFKTIRNSYVTGTLLTGLLSNVIVFAQPLEQIHKRNKSSKAKQIAYTDSYSNSVEKNRPEDKGHSRNTHEKNTKDAKKEIEKKSSEKENTLVFNAFEKLAVVGKTGPGKENPRDNFFRLALPDTIDWETQKAVLKYELYGLESADQTSKSINENEVYGGGLIKTNKKWTSVKENIPSSMLKKGLNDIFFNRRGDKDYFYKIKDLRIELVSKKEKDYFKINPFHNYNGKLYAGGQVPEEVKTIYIDGKSIEVRDGLFEAILDGVDNDKETVSLSYISNSKQITKNIGVEYHKTDPSFQFSNDHFALEVSELSLLSVSDKVVFRDLTLRFEEPSKAISAKQVKINGLGFKSLKPLNSDLENVTSGIFHGYRTKVSELKDSSVARVHLKYDASKIPNGYSDKDVRTFAFDREKREWVALPVDSLDYENNLVVSLYSGDTDYINGVIKVPEMAETASFTPTTITDMEYANPAAGVVSIAPPSPNNNGTANTGFPIKLPKGRNGMMPSLGLNYSSESGNGWMGLGWDLQLPAVTLDTRWGVPLFDPTNESEIYLLNGEQLVYKEGAEYSNPHRGYGGSRNTGGIKTLYLRKEGSYQKVTRYGYSPQTYCWLVTDKYGNESYYGGYGNIDESYVVRDEQNNITHWALYQTNDINENYVKYYYNKGTEVVNGLDTQYFYPEKIEYTLNSNNPLNSSYEVEFIRNNGSSQSIREDIILNARTGTLMSTADLLTELVINYKEGSQINKVRSYEFDYATSAFNKKLLSKVSEFDTEGNLFYSNTIEYYDDVQGNALINTSSVNWAGTPSSLDSDLPGSLVPNSLPIPQGSALGSGNTNGFSAGMRFGVGLGRDIFSTNNSAGYSYNYAQNTERTKVSFIDINGDGLPDKVFEPSSGNLKYLPNLGTDANGNGIFGSAKTVSSGLSDLNSSKSRTNTHGVDANLFGVVGAGKSWSKTRTSTEGYFTDFNGDGLPDVITGGTVKFNYTDAWDDIAQSDVEFGNLANETENLIYSGAVDQDLLQNLELETKPELREEHSQFDHIKAWKAPYTGIVTITGQGTLISENTCAETTEPNNFRLTIEKRAEGDTTLPFELTGNLSLVGASVNMNKTLSVTKGDYLFFRVHNLIYGCGGEVVWNPTITYSPLSNIPNDTDEQGNQYRVFSAEDDFMENNGSGWSPSGIDTSIEFIGGFNLNETTLTTYNLSDDVTFTIEKATYTHETTGNNQGQINGVTTESISVTFNPESNSLSFPTGNWGTIEDISNQYINNGDFSYSYNFFVESDSNVDWNKLDWQPIIENQDSERYYPSVNYRTYDDNINQINYQVLSSGFPSANIDPNDPSDEDNFLLLVEHNMFDSGRYSEALFGSYENEEFPIEINWLVKEEINGIVSTIHKETFYLHRGSCHLDIFDLEDSYCNYQFRTEEDPQQGFAINPSNITHEDFFKFPLTKKMVDDLKANSGNKIYSAFFIDNSKFGFGNSADINILLHPDAQGSYSYSGHTIDSPFMGLSPTFYGWTYRGWGQFLYNGGIKYTYDDDGNILSGPESFDGYIDMSLFDFNVDTDALQQDMDNLNANPESGDINNAIIRYTNYIQDNQNDSYENEAIKTDVDTPVRYGFSNGQLSVSLGRFAEHDIYELYTDPNDLLNGSAFPGLKQRSISKGKATSGNFVNFSGTDSEADSKVLNQYVDVNGDRYPDIVTDGDIQFTDMRGGLGNKMIDNEFTSGAKSEDDIVGVTISGAQPNSTESSNMDNTKTNSNSGINTSEGNTYNSRQWIDINGDGLVDKITISQTEVVAEINTGYDFSSPVSWGAGYSGLFVSERKNMGLGGGISGSSWAAGFGLARSTAKLFAALIDVNGDGLPDLVKNSEGYGSPSYTYYLNNGSGFATSGNSMFHDGAIDTDISVSGNAYGTATYGFFIDLLFTAIKFVGTPTVGINAGVNEKQTAIQDIDGDGYPDVLDQGNDNGSIVAKLNRTGRTHLIKKVNTPLGGSWSVDYERAGNTFALPQNKWVLSNITTNDGFSGDTSDGSGGGGANFSYDETFTEISYENPHHDRREREFLGFGTMKVEQKDPGSPTSTYRYTIKEYHNENIYLKGLQTYSAMFDGSDNILSESSTLYNIMDPENPQVNTFADGSNQYLQSGLNESLLDRSRLFVAPVKTISTTYENGEGLSVEQQFTDYDGHGNLLTYKNLGDTFASFQGQDAYRTELEYHPESHVSNGQNTVGYVKKIQVFKENGGDLLREREAQYNGYGQLSDVKTKLNDSGDYNSVHLDYDPNYGNLLQYTDDSGFVTALGYDLYVATYPIFISNTFGESSSSEYDYLFGVPVSVTDMNGEQMRTRIDNRGRIVEVTSPKEMSSSGWTLRMQYEGEDEEPTPWNGSNYMVMASGSFDAVSPGIEPPNVSHYAVTHHYVDQAASNQLLTMSLVDGMGKVIQLKKTHFTNDTGSNQIGWLVSGREKKDGFGRVEEAYLPSFHFGYPSNPNDVGMIANVFDFEPDPNAIPPTVMTYDARDRTTSVKQPDESNMATTNYSVADGMFLTTMTNELNQTLESYTDVRGRQRKTVQNGEITTEFFYNAVGEKIRVKNEQGYETFYRYDLAGRRIEERHPDHGLQLFKYDTSGNLIERRTSNIILGNPDHAIKYVYDFNRLIEIQYPQNPENDVYYTYGDVNDGDAVDKNAIGRLYIQQDASGVQAFGYDELGNMNENLRGVAVANRHTFWYHTRWDYDSHNRVRNIYYPDGETVTYNYNWGGELNDIERTIGNFVTNEAIVSKITYNNLGERTQIDYGNGTSTSYTYDSRRRLQNLGHQFNGFAVMNQYGYDELSNVKNITTLNPQNTLPGNNQLGGPIAHTYEYDDFNRLTSANGSYVGPNDMGTDLLAHEYTLGMSYDSAHNITGKTQTHIQGEIENYGDAITDPQTMMKTDYSLNYDGYATGTNIVSGDYGEYGYVQPHAPREVVETPSSGNFNSSHPEYKKMEIEYDANGNQLSVSQVVNGDEQQGPAFEGNVQQQTMMLHKNIWDEEDRLRAVDLNPEEGKGHQLAVYTYDAGGQRAVRYIPGRLDINSNSKNVSRNERDEVMLYPSSLITVKAISEIGSNPAAGDSVSSYTKHYYIGSERVNSTLGTVEDLGLYPPIKATDFSSVRPMTNQIVSNANTAFINTYVAMEQTITLSSGTEGELERYVHDSEKYDTYYYHNDHLGSSSYISNKDGYVSQHMEYLPYGETLVEEHQNSYNSPFKFNGKELDDETGNYYYGARYYNPKWSVWLSVDPLREKMPSWSSYNYTFSNPIKFIDPTGMEPETAKWPPKWMVTIYNKAKKFYDENDFVFNFESESSVKVGFGGELSLGREGDPNQVKLVADAKLIEVEIGSINVDFESNKIEYDHIGKDDKMHIKQGVEISLESGEKKLTVIDAYNNFDSNVHDGDTSNENSDLIFFENSELVFDTEYGNAVDFSQKHTDSKGNSVSNKYSSSNKLESSVTREKNNGVMFNGKIKGGAFFNVSLSFNFGFKPKD